MNTSRILITSLLIAGLAAAPAIARNGGGNNGGNNQSNRGARQQSSYCDGSGVFCNGLGTCDGSGVCTNTPLKDGSGKAANNRGNSNATGTPLKDGSGKASAPGNGPKDGTGNNANCPNGN